MMRLNYLIMCFLAAALSVGCLKAHIYEVGSTEELKAVKGIQPGDTVIWKNGTYSNVTVKFKAKGTEDAPVVLMPQTPGGVVFKGASSISLDGQWCVAKGFSFNGLDTSVKYSVLTTAKTSSYCRFSDCRIDGKGSKASSVDTKWVSMYGHHNEISHCTFLDKRNMGCLLVVWMEEGVVPCHTIKNNSFTRPYTHYDDNGNARNGQESIRIGTSTYSLSDADCVVTGNYFYKCDGERAEIISNKSCGNLYEGNLFEDSVGTLTLRHGNRCTVRGNYFISSGREDVGGVRVIGEDHLVENNVMHKLTGKNYNTALCVVKGESGAELNGYWTVKNLVFKNNTIIDCLNGILLNYGKRETQDSHPLNLVFENNTIVSEKSYHIVMNVMDMPDSEIHWNSNAVCGGKSKGYSLEMVKVKPAMADFSSEIDIIRKNSGTRW